MAISDDGEELFIVVEDLPKYPGGIYELAKYIAEMQENLARIDNIKGKAKIMFTISETGKVTNISVSEWNNQKVLKAAATIASQMPDWTPGKQHGKSVPVKYLMPVEFK